MLFSVILDITLIYAINLKLEYADLAEAGAIDILRFFLKKEKKKKKTPLDPKLIGESDRILYSSNCEKLLYVARYT